MSSATAPESAAAAAEAAPRRSPARWIWYRLPPLATAFRQLETEPEHRNAFMLARRSITLGEVPASARVRVTADGRYIAWLNGLEIGRGPIRSRPGALNYDELDLATHLRPGENVLAMVVRHYGVPVPWWSPAPSYAHLGRGGLHVDSEALPELASGSGWRVRRGPWRVTPPLSFGPPNEDLDARDLPAGWMAPGFDDSAWDAAVDISSAPLWGSPRDGAPALPASPFTVVDANPLPAPLEKVRDARPIARLRAFGDVPAVDRRYVWPDPLYATGGLFQEVPGPAPQLPVRVEPGEAVTFDFGELVLGVPAVEYEAERGAAIVLRAGELLDGGAPFDFVRQWANRRVSPGGHDLAQPFETVGLRYLTVAAEAPLTVTSVRLRERVHPLPLDAEFSCDDPDLEAIWRIGRRTLELCSTDAYLDCPGREQRAWLGDAYVHALLTYFTSADQRLPKHALRLAASSRRGDGLLGMVAAGDLATEALTIPDYSLHWIRSLARAWEHTGDAELVEELLPLCPAILDWYWRHVRDGVLQPMPGWVFVDWYPLQAEAPNCTLQGLLALALADHARLAREFEQPRVAARSEERRRQLLAGFAGFWDPEREVYVDEAGVVTQHAQAMAVLNGVVSGAEAAALLERVSRPEVLRYPVRVMASARMWETPDDFDAARHVVATQPYFAHWLHQAYAQAGRKDLLLESIRRWRAFVDAGDGTVWEFWPGLDDRASHCHAWSATPTYDLLAHLAGVRPAAPGWEEVEIEPWLGPLRRLEAAIPTPRGLIRISVTPEGRTVELPKGITVR